MKFSQNYSIDYNKCEYLPDKKNPTVMKTCLSEGKLMKKFGNTSLSKSTSLFQLIPYFWEGFSWPPLFVQISKTRTPSNFRGDCVYPLETLVKQRCKTRSYKSAKMEDAWKNEKKPMEFTRQITVFYLQRISVYLYQQKPVSICVHPYYIGKW